MKRFFLLIFVSLVSALIFSCASNKVTISDETFILEETTVSESQMPEMKKTEELKEENILLQEEVKIENPCNKVEEEKEPVLEDPEAIYNEAMIWLKKSEYGKAVPLFQKASELWENTDDIRMYDAIYSIGFCYYGLKDWDNAIINMEIARKEFPNDRDLKDFLESARDWKEISY